MATASMKKAILIAAALIIGVISTITIIHKTPTPGPIAPPLAKNEKEEDKGQVRVQTAPDTAAMAEMAQADLADSYSISGWVVNALSDEPVAGIELYINRPGMQLPKSISDTTGAFEFNKILEGGYTVALAPDAKAFPEDYYISENDRTLHVNVTGKNVTDVVFLLHLSVVLFWMRMICQ